MYNLGMHKFAGALMYVLREVFGLEKKYFVCEAGCEAGEFLLQEIMMAGNFGHFDERQKVASEENGIQRFLRRMMRNVRFLKYYPEEVVCVPLYRMYQEFWRVKMN